MCFVNSLSSNLKRLLGSFWPTLIVDEAHVDKVYPLGKHYADLMEEMGYMHLQATKPDTVGKSECLTFCAIVVQLSLRFEVAVVFFFLINTLSNLIFIDFGL
jgi:hypothetical protein